MTSSESLSSLEPWTCRTLLTNTWVSEAFARDTDALTKALQISISNETDANHPFIHVSPPVWSPVSASEPETTPTSRNVPISSGKIAKRKSRATKKSPTTFITADPANFRQMVQQVTGIRFSNPDLSVGPVLKPEPQRPSNRSLPTLDTSAFLLDHQQRVVRPAVPQGSGYFAPEVNGAGLDFEAFQTFPTLESWGVI